MNEETHIPRSFDCCNCVYGSRDCSFIDFTKMRPVKTYSDGVTAVVCSERE